MSTGRFLRIVSFRHGSIRPVVRGRNFFARCWSPWQRQHSHCTHTHKGSCTYKHCLFQGTKCRTILNYNRYNNIQSNKAYEGWCGETKATTKGVNFLVRFPNWYFLSTTTNTKHQAPIWRKEECSCNIYYLIDHGMTAISNQHYNLTGRSLWAGWGGGPVRYNFPPSCYYF